MSDQELGLNIKITADVSSALRNFTQLTDATGELVVEGKGNIAAVNLALKDLRESVKSTGNVTELNVLNRAIKDLSSEATRLGRAGTAGFDEIGNKLPKVAAAVVDGEKKIGEAAEEANKKASASNFSLLGGLNSTYSLIRRIAFVLPGIGIAGLIGALSEGIISLFSNSSKAAKEAAQTNKEYFATFQTKAPIDIAAAKSQLDEYKKAVEDAVGGTSKESAQVDVLVARLQAGNTTRKEQTAIIKELQKIAPDYFAKLDAEKVNVEKVTEAYQKYNEAIISSIEAQVHISEITELVKKRLDFARQTPDAAKFVNDLLSQGKTLGDIGNIAGQAFSKANQGAAQAGLLGKANSAELEKQALLNSKIPFGVQTIVKFLEQEKDLLKQISDTSLKNIGVDVGKGSKTKAVDELEKEIQALEQTKTALQALFKSGDRPGYEIQRQLDQINTKLLEDKIAKAIRDGAKEGLPRNIIQEQVSALQQELDKISQVKPARIKFELEPIKNPESTIEKAFGKPGELPVIRFNAKIQAIVDYAKYFDEIKKDIGKQLSDLAASGVEGLAAGIGKALAGKGNPFDGFLKLLGEGLERIGKYLISVSPLIIALQTALKNLGTINPAVLLLAGVGLVAVGAAIKSNIKATPFAEGGIVTGPTYGLVGEAGPEAIFPLDKLSSFLGGFSKSKQDVNLAGEFRLNGNDLILVAARAQKNRNLVQ